MRDFLKDCKSEREVHMTFILKKLNVSCCVGFARGTMLSCQTSVILHNFPRVLKKERPRWRSFCVKKYDKKRY